MEGHGLKFKNIFAIGLLIISKIDIMAICLRINNTVFKDKNLKWKKIK
jgi:hypothetical protein